MAGSVSGPLARIKVEKNCYGMIEWQAVREAARGFSPSTRQQQCGNIGNCLMLNKKDSCQSRRIEVQSMETPTAPWNAAWPSGWWRPKHGGAQPRSRRQSFVDWCSRSFRTAVIASRPRSQSAQNSQHPAWWPGEAHRSRRPAARVAEKRRAGGLVVHGRRRHHVSPDLGAVLPAGIRRRQCESWLQNGTQKKRKSSTT